MLHSKHSCCKRYLQGLFWHFVAQMADTSWHCAAKVLLTALQPSAASDLPTESPGSLTFGRANTCGHRLCDIDTEWPEWAKNTIHCGTYCTCILKPELISKSRLIWTHLGLPQCQWRPGLRLASLLVHKHTRSLVCFSTFDFVSDS